MIKTLSKHGNSLALILDRPILDLLKIDQDTPLEITTDGSAFFVRPAHDEKRRRKFKAALAKTNERFGRALERLAK
ncbi:MAG: AbrB/MazE/SpoVT family DNA-binding domain-containing protein [Deltaproteobacteria bacterium]|nr:AbrB/MazE/SpoVT family DNA-binding domain-containing protein [Deltaproteobacteria bacterium]